MPRSTVLVDFALALPLALLVAAVIAWLVRRIFGARLSLPFAVMTIVSTLGLSVGLFVAGWFIFGLRLWMPVSLLMTLTPSFYAAARRQLHQRGLLRCDWLAALQSPQNR